MLTRREDVQWLRAVAIGAVLAFHLRRDLFPLGFLGVDVFFVISGFLMTAILDRPSRESPFRVALTFYDRRIRRILPTYLLVLAGTLAVGLWLVFMPVDASVLVRDGVWSLAFAANLQPLVERVDYFQLTSDFRPLAHTWSLGVELQFYLIAPALLQTLLVSRRPFLIATALAVASAWLHCLSATAWAFGFVPCRLWQFLIGTLVHLLHCSPDPNFQLLPVGKEHEKGGEMAESNFGPKVAVGVCLFALLTVCTWPGRPETALFEFLARLSATLLTGAIMLGGRELEQLVPTGVGEGLSAVGDASYSVYLAHWPLLVFGRYSGWEMDSIVNFFLFITLLAISSMALWRLVEQQVPKLSKSTVYGVIGTIFLTVGAMLCFYAPPPSQGWKLPDVPIPVSESIRLNQDMAVNCDKLPFACAKDELLKNSFHIKHPREDQLEGRCVVNVTERGVRTMAVIGNCFAMRHFPMVLEALETSRHRETFSKAYLANFRGCTSFDSVNGAVPEKYECEEKKGQTLTFLRKLRPDLLVIVNRLDHVPTIQAPLVLDQDDIVNRMRKDLSELTRTATQVVVVEPHHVVGNRGRGSAASISNTLRLGAEVNASIMWQNRKAAFDMLGDSWKRMSKAMDTCSNCHVLKSLDQFCNSSMCGVVNPVTKLSYFCDGAHLSPAGASMLLPSLRHLLNQLTFGQRGSAYRK